MNQQIAIPFNSLGLNIIFISNGMVGFGKTRSFPLTFDMGNNVVISDDLILVEDENYRYNVGYNLTEKLKKWLVSLNLVQPY